MNFGCLFGQGMSNWSYFWWSAWKWSCMYNAACYRTQYKSCFILLMPLKSLCSESGVCVILMSSFHRFRESCSEGEDGNHQMPWKLKQELKDSLVDMYKGIFDLYDPAFLLRELVLCMYLSPQRELAISLWAPSERTFLEDSRLRHNAQLSRTPKSKFLKTETLLLTHAVCVWLQVELTM